MNPRHDVRAVARQFQISGDFLSAGPCDSGHINDTGCVVFDRSGARVRCIFQRINHGSFKDPVFAALVRAYLASAADFLTLAGKCFLPFSGKLISFEAGLRFLTNFPAGDSYFNVQRDGHNLDRCRTQFKLFESIEQQEENMNQLVEAI